MAGLACLTATAYPRPQAALAAPDYATEQLVHDATNHFLDAMRNGAPREQVTETLNRYVALGSIALFVLGKHRRHLKPDQEQRYISLFEGMVLNAITKYGKIFATGLRQAARPTPASAVDAPMRRMKLRRLRLRSSSSRISAAP